MQIESHWNILFLGILPALIFLWFKYLRWRKNKQQIFAEYKFHHQFFAKKSFLNKVFPYLYFVAVFFLVLALINFISYNKEEIKIKQKSGNILFLVDVSNSMNAEDIAPSRLEQAKQILTQSLENLSDERVGIVVFAGKAQSIMPLTTDYSSASIYLNSINSDLIQVQGTDFLVAIEEANKKLKNVNSGAKKVILISDGEDNEGNHNAAIREAQKAGISITTIGIGTDEGAPIPEFLFNYYRDYKRDEYGQIVITKRETSALKTIAKETNGKYIDGNNAQNAIKDIVKDIQDSAKETLQNTMNSLNTHYYYQWFLGISVFLFLIIYLFNPKQDLEF